MSDEMTKEEASEIILEYLSIFRKSKNRDEVRKNLLEWNGFDTGQKESNNEID